MKKIKEYSKLFSVLVIVFVIKPSNVFVMSALDLNHIMKLFYLLKIFYFVLSQSLIYLLSFISKKIYASFLVLRIISDSIGILVLWLSIVLWNEDLSDEDHFTPGFLCITLISLILMSLIDISSFIIFCISKCVSIQIVIYSFIIHTILSIGTIIFDRFKIR